MFGLRPSKPVYEAGQIMDFGEFRLRLRVNARAIRISLRLDNKTGEAVVSAPRPRDLKKAVEFALSRTEWIKKHIKAMPKPSLFMPEMDIPVLGSQIRLLHSGTRAGTRASAVMTGGVITAGGEAVAYHRRIERLLKLKALEFAQTYTAVYAQRLGIDTVAVTLFDAKGRWGSCTPSRRAIRYSWRLIMAPETVFTYVCAHEVAHLKHPHHGPAFWAEVEQLFGNHKLARQWLKSEGGGLFTYGTS
jgi:predicted metal-dependent hydrolase